MALAGGVGGLFFDGPPQEQGAAAWFAEDQGLYIVTTSEDSEQFIARGEAAGVSVQMLGRCSASDEAKLFFDLPGFDCVIPLAVLRAAHEGALPKALKGEL
jgi:hypothetical protein